MQYTWRRGWRTVLGRTDSWERGFLLDSESYAERKVLEAEVSRRCWASHIGLADCRDVRARCRLRRWARHGRRIYVEHSCLLQPTGERTTVRLRSPVRT